MTKVRFGRIKLIKPKIMLLRRDISDARNRSAAVIVCMPGT